MSNITKFEALVNEFFAVEILELERQEMGLENSLREINDKIENFDASDYVSESDYDDMLDDCYEDVEICGYTYSTSVVLKRVDNVAYRCGFADYVGTTDLDDIEEYRDLVAERNDVDEQHEKLGDYLQRLYDVRAQLNDKENMEVIQELLSDIYYDFDCISDDLKPLVEFDLSE